MDQIAVFYVTMPSQETAQAMAHRLVSQRLAACVNILAPCLSVYEWQGNIETTAEVPLIAKTSRATAQALKAAMLDQHPHTCPCVLELGVADSSADFLAWVNAQTTTSI